MALHYFDINIVQIRIISLTLGSVAVANSQFEHS